jgi:flagellar hook-associated protein 3 FlgL
MSNRITQMMVARSVLTDLQSTSERLSATQRKLSSGKEITRPSDDPYGATRAIGLRSELEATRQYQRNVDDGIAWANATDVSLGKIGDAAQRVRELLVQGASDAAGPTSRSAAADEIDQLVEALKQEADSAYGGHYIFAGTATTTRPYAVGGSDAYAGNGGAIMREIGPGVSVPINVVGSDLLGSGQAAADGKFLNVLRDIADHLRAGTPAASEALRTTDLRALDSNLDALMRARAGVGATVNRLETAASRLSEVEETQIGLLSKTEDADMAKTMIDFSMQQSVYQSALKSGANIVQASLLDFLR